MKKSVTKIVKATVAFAMAIGAGVGAGISGPKQNPVFATDGFDTQYTLDTSTCGNTSSNRYDGTGTATITNNEHSIGWTFAGNGQQAPWRIGGKGGSNNNSEQTVNRRTYTTTALNAKVDRIEITLGAVSNANLVVNSMSVSVYNNSSDATNDSNAIASFSPEYTSTSTIIITNNGASWNGKYYAFNFNITITGKSNYFFNFTKVEFLEKASSKTLSSIALSGTYPTSFYAGDEFNHEGMIVTATYSDSSTKNVTQSATFTGYNMSTDGEQTVTVSYTENAITKTATYGITVNPAKILSNITISGYTTAINRYGQFVFGGIVTAHYSNAPDLDVTQSATFTGYDILTIGEQTVTVSYTENAITKTATYGITVNPASSLTITKGDVTGLGIYGGNNGDAPFSFVKGVATLSTTCGFGNTNYFHIYKGATMTISSSVTMIKIELTDAEDSNPLSGFGSLDGYSDGVWEGEATSVTFTASEKQVHMVSVKITFLDDTQYVEVDPSSFVLKTYQHSGVRITATPHNINNPTFDWSKNNNSIIIEETINDNEIVVKPNTRVNNSTAKIFLTVGGANPALAPVEIDVTIKLPEDGEAPETAFTISEAVSAIEATQNKAVDGTVFVKGIISQIDSYNGSYHSLTYWISDDGTTTNQFEVYGGLNFNGANFSSIDDLTIGAQVIVKGNIKWFAQNSVYEFNANSQLVYYSNAVLHATEADGNLNYVSIIFKAKITNDAWNSFGTATEFGMMLFKSSKDNPSSVENRYNLDPNKATNPTTVLVVNGDNGLTLDDEGDNCLSMTLEVGYIKDFEYGYKFCVAPYLVSNEEHHFLSNMMWSVNKLAQKGLIDMVPSETNLNALKGVQN